MNLDISRTRFLMLALAATGAVLCASAHAEEAAAVEDPFMKLATVRAKVEIALRDGRQVFDNSKNGYDAAETAIENNKDKIGDLLSQAKEVNQEDRKFVAECEKRQASVQRKWDSASRAFDTDISKRYEDARGVYEDICRIFAQVADFEPEWKKAKLELSPLETAYGAMEKRLAEVKAQGEKATADLKEEQNAWDAELSEIEKFTTPNKNASTEEKAQPPAQ